MQAPSLYYEQGPIQGEAASRAMERELNGGSSADLGFVTSGLSLNRNYSYSKKSNEPQFGNVGNRKMKMQESFSLNF